MESLQNRKATGRRRMGLQGKPNPLADEAIVAPVNHDRQNGNQKRHIEEAIETATRRGNLHAQQKEGTAKANGFRSGVYSIRVGGRHSPRGTGLHHEGHEEYEVEAGGPAVSGPKLAGKRWQAMSLDWILEKARERIEVFKGTIRPDGSYKDRIFQSVCSAIQQIANDYGDRFLLELIQNGYDAHPPYETAGSIHIYFDPLPSTLPMKDAFLAASCKRIYTDIASGCAKA
ncbi:MAG: hypothetical protein P4L55_21970 [Syntrophobacteraceae bacterium]|nr:hypothetical protein [Syntrophobacteraceae bacterium]